MNEILELDTSAQYWLDAGGQHLTCDAWAIDEADYEGWEGHKLVYVSAMGSPQALQQATRALRFQAARVHITSSDRSRWHTMLNTTALNDSQLFRTPLPETLMHHMTLMPADRWFERNNQLKAKADKMPIYLFPESEERLPESLGNNLRRLTHLLCPPQWDRALLTTCRRLQLIQPLEAHGVSGWKLNPDVEPIQAEISLEVRRGNLRL